MKMLLPALAPPQPEALSPLDEGLRGPGAQLLRERTLAQLQDLELRTRAEMSAGAAPQRYRELAALLDACRAAQEVLGNGPAPGAGSSMGASVRLA